MYKNDMQNGNYFCNDVSLIGHFHMKNHLPVYINIFCGMLFLCLRHLLLINTASAMVIDQYFHCHTLLWIIKTNSDVVINQV